MANDRMACKKFVRTALDETLTRLHRPTHPVILYARSDGRCLTMWVLVSFVVESSVRTGRTDTAHVLLLTRVGGM
jgi:hypothetical protein